MAQSIWKPLLLVMIMILAMNLIYTYVAKQAQAAAEISYSRFRQELAADNVRTVTIKGGAISGEFRVATKVVQTIQGSDVTRSVSAFTTVLPSIGDTSLMADLTAKGVEVKAISAEVSTFTNLLIYMLPWVLILGFWWFGMAAAWSAWWRSC